MCFYRQIHYLCGHVEYRIVPNGEHNLSACPQQKTGTDGLRYCEGYNTIMRMDEKHPTRFCRTACRLRSKVSCYLTWIQDFHQLNTIFAQEYHEFARSLFATSNLGARLEHVSASSRDTIRQTFLGLPESNSNFKQRLFTTSFKHFREHFARVLTEFSTKEINGLPGFPSAEITVDTKLRLEPYFTSLEQSVGPCHADLDAIHDAVNDVVNTEMTPIDDAQERFDMAKAWFKKSNALFGDIGKDDLEEMGLSILTRRFLDYCEQVDEMENETEHSDHDETMRTTAEKSHYTRGRARLRDKQDESTDRGRERATLEYLAHLNLDDKANLTSGGFSTDDDSADADFDEMQL